MSACAIRHDPGRYLLSRSRAPALVEPDDILEYTLDSEPVKPPIARPYSERVIHGCIYQARSDVMAVCHHHAAAVLPFCIAGKPIKPVFHLGAVIGDETPMWDQHDEFGDTNLLVVKPEEGRSLARALGQHSVVLMLRHGATVVGNSLKELVSALDLHLPKCRVSVARAHARLGVAVVSRRDQAGRRAPSEARRRGPGLGILLRAPQGKRRLAAEGHGEGGAPQAEVSAARHVPPPRKKRRR